MINIESEEYAAFGAEVKKSLSTFMNDRLGCELQWMSNLRQYRGKYDPKVLAKISEERSRAYPRDTRIKVKGGVAKMMEMMFPAKENNWELKVSPVPSIPKSELTRIISELQSAAALAGEEVASDQIEREVKAFAEARKDLMQEEIADQLADKGIDYPNMCKKVIRSGYIYGFGVAKGPMVRTQTEREWVPDGDSFKAVEHQVKRPYPEYVRTWDFYPDFTANSWEAQERCFERFILNRGDLSLLKKRPDFLKTAINSYLVDHPSGNYKAQSFESELNELSNTTNVVDRMKRLYEIYRCVGFFSAHTLQKIGVEVKEEDLGKEVFADVWFIDDIVIKIDLAEAVVGNKPSEFYHAFIYAEDEDSGITGIGLPEEVNDSQMSVGAATRALFDNMASTAGPMYEVNIDLLPPGVKSMGSIHAFKTIERTGEGVAAQYPAVRDLKTTSHIPELLSIISMARQQLDVESNLPAYTMGGAQQPLGEAFRTTSNMSMMQGGANMVTKDTVRAFDKFTTSVINSMLKWNMEFNPNEAIKGEYGVSARGNVSLVAKEVRGAALDQLTSTLSPEERAITDVYGLLIDRFKSRDLPADRVLPEEEAREILKSMREAAAQSSSIEQGLTQAKTDDTTASAEKKRMDAQVIAASTDATIKEILSRAKNNAAMANSSESKVQLENLEALLRTSGGQ